jgi:hypothetical protein
MSQFERVPRPQKALDLQGKHKVEASSSRSPWRWGVTEGLPKRQGTAATLFVMQVLGRAAVRAEMRAIVP